MKSDKRDGNGPFMVSSPGKKWLNRNITPSKIAAELKFVEIRNVQRGTGKRLAKMVKGEWGGGRGGRWLAENGVVVDWRVGGVEKGRTRRNEFGGRNVGSETMKMWINAGL